MATVTEFARSWVCRSPVEIDPLPG